MSDRLISADKARQVLTHLLYETALNNDDYIMDIYEDIIENRLDTWIKLIPTVDAEPVVRCKECIYKNGKINSKGFEVCDATGMDITDNDFCSWGERREDAEIY